MKTSLVIATLAVLGAGAVSAGAAHFVPSTAGNGVPFQGSDTEGDLTNAAIDPSIPTNGTIHGSGLGTSGDYQGGGSGAGEGAMTSSSPKQQAAPMSKMLTKSTCTTNTGTDDAGLPNYTHASGIATALDAVDVYSSLSAGGSTACNGTTDDAGTGLNFGGTGSPEPTGAAFANWTDMLALLYGGLDKTNNTTDCNSAKRQALVANWSNMFENGCTTQPSTCTSALMPFGANKVSLAVASNSAVGGSNTCSSSCTAAGCAGAACTYQNAGTVCGGNGSTCTAVSPTANGSAPIWHAYRRDDNSGTSDAFASLIGLGTLFDGNGNKLFSDGVSSSGIESGTQGNNNGYGVSPYCNVINWDTREQSLTINGTTFASGNTSCALGEHRQYVGPGGVYESGSFCSGGTAPGNATQYTNGVPTSGVGAACTTANQATVCTGGSTCVSFNDNVHKRPPPGTWGDVPDSSQAINGVPVGAAALPTSYQDNDPIRRPCIGRTSFVGNTSAPAEEVCNIDGKLGVVIPIPPVDFIPDNFPTGGIGGAARTAFNTTACNGFISSNSFKVFLCPLRSTPTFSSGCANSDGTVGGGCFSPQSTSLGSTLCENQPTNWPQDSTRSATIGAGDARAYNLFVTDGSNGYTTFTITAVNQIETFGGAYARIHQTLPLWDAANPAGTLNSICQQTDATDQIACLTQADACSFGYAGDPGKSWFERFPTTLVDIGLCSGGSNAGAPCYASSTCTGGGTCSPLTPTAGTDALRVNQIYPTTATVTVNSYDLWRKIYYNSSAGFDQAALNDNTTTGQLDQLALAEYESNPDTMTALASTFGFFGFQRSPNASSFPGDTNAGNAPFCEDFNETMIGTANSGTCETSTPNRNACNFNLLAQTPSDLQTAGVIPVSGAAPITNYAPIPSDPSIDPLSATTSTVCGNGIQETFEDCDFGASENGGSGANSFECVGGSAKGTVCTSSSACPGSICSQCSATCRLVFP